MFYVKFGLHVHLLLAFAKKVMYVVFNIYMYYVLKRVVVY